MEFFINPFRLNLRARFIIATLAVAIVPLSGFIYVTANLIELYEDDVLNAELERKMNIFEQVFRSNPSMQAPQQPALEGHILRPGDNTPLPNNLPDMPAGSHHEIEIGDGEYNVVRRDVDGTRLYLIQDMAQIESFEQRAEQIAWVCGILALFFAIIVAFIMGNLVLRPVTLLAERVAQIKPGQTRTRLALEKTDREINAIAQAFDNVLEQFDEFASREQHFTQDASHELRTPLAIMMSGTELIAQDPDLSKKARVRLRRVQTAARQMQELIEALLFLAREDGGGFSQSCSVQEVLEKAIPAFEETLPLQHPILHLEIQGDHITKAPSGMILAVINNLLRNAVEHGDYGPVSMCLSEQKLVVEDSGPGINTSELPHVFTHGSKGPESRGQGIGLSIVKRICDRLGWQIKLYSPPGAGARFELEFPSERLA